MSISNLFERIASRQHQRRQQTIANFRELVTAVAMGQEPQPEAVELKHDLAPLPSNHEVDEVVDVQIGRAHV